MHSSPNIVIRDTNPFHLHEMAENMSADSANTAKKLGLTPKKALWYSYRKSIFCKSAFINEKLAAIWGIYGKVFADTGAPWLIMTPETQKYPMRVAFRYKKEIEKMQIMFPILEEFVPETNDKSIRMLELMGFKVSKNTIKVGDEIFRRAERKRA